MNTPAVDVPLTGCAPVPLAHYLKALGILRLVSQQRDANAKGFWKNDIFHLISTLDRDALVNFFLDPKGYHPTPVVVPWSGGDFFAVNRSIRPGERNNGFAKKPTSSDVIEAVLGSESERLADYRSVIALVFDAMDASGVRTKQDIEGNAPQKQTNKSRLLQALRNLLPDRCIDWVDAANVIERRKPSANNLLGSGGGNDGNSHFSDNFMQALWLVLPDFDAQRARPIQSASRMPFDSAAALRNALFNEPSTASNIAEFSPVLFNSACVGGPNATSGFEANAASNPWDFILMLEGACLFAGAISKKLGSQSSGVARFPFLVDATPVGSGAVGQTDEGREIWLPLWAGFAGLDEVARLFAEARLEKFGQPATRGFDAFVALAQHGSDRGIAEFQRIGLVRGRIGGENYFTSFDQGRFRVREEKSVNVLAELEDWYRSISDLARSDLCPASLRSALRSYESRVLRLAQHGGSEAALDVLLALGRLEGTLSRSSAKARVRPVPPLSNDWLRYVNSTGKEFRLAAALASTWSSHDGKYLPLRAHLEAAEIKGGATKRWAAWLENGSNDVVWREGVFIETLNAIFARRLVLEQQGEKHLADRSVCPIHFSDLTALIDDDVDDELIGELLWGLALLDWQAVKPDDLPAAPSEPEIAPSAFYALLKLCFTRPAPDEEPVPLMPAIHRRAARGDGASASALAARRLRASGFAPAVEKIPVAGQLVRRTGAALLFPLRNFQTAILRKTILRPELEPAAAL